MKPWSCRTSGASSKSLFHHKLHNSCHRTNNWHKQPVRTRRTTQSHTLLHCASQPKINCGLCLFPIPDPVLFFQQRKYNTNWCFLPRSSVSLGKYRLCLPKRVQLPKGRCCIKHYIKSVVCLKLDCRRRSNSGHGTSARIHRFIPIQIKFKTAGKW